MVIPFIIPNVSPRQVYKFRPKDRYFLPPRNYLILQVFRRSYVRSSTKSVSVGNCGPLTNKNTLLGLLTQSKPLKPCSTESFEVPNVILGNYGHFRYDDDDDDCHHYQL